VTATSTSPRLVACQQCKGKGGHWARIQNLGTRAFEDHYVTCFHEFCEGGTVDMDRYYASWRNWGKPQHTDCRIP
jgi:hypothetical protein